MSIEDNCWIENLIVNDKELKKEFNLRKDNFEYESIKKESLIDYKQKGWELHLELKKTYKIKKEKLNSEKLKNKFWKLLFQMNYKEMNKGNDFYFVSSKKSCPLSTKKIDIFAKDDETIIIANCYSEDVRKEKSLLNEIKSFDDSMGMIGSEIRNFYGRAFKPKILWFIVTENIIISEEEKEFSDKCNIKILSENELPYYENIVKHLGAASKYQLLAEYFSRVKIPELENKKVLATKGKLGGNTFYSFVTTPRHLLKISFVNHISIKDPDGLPTYQRIVQKTRLNKISEYIKGGGFFPTNLLINFNQNVNFDLIEKDTDTGVQHGKLILPSKFKSAWIIDGQHRLYGYSNLEDKFLDENIFVLAFENMSHEDEAKLFVTINQEQKSVSKTIIDSLEGELKWGSSDPKERIGAISTRIVNQLGISMESPIYDRIIEEGTSKTNQKCLTLPEIKEGIKKSKLIGTIENKVLKKGLLYSDNDNETVKKTSSFLIKYLKILKNKNLTLWNEGRNSYLWNNISLKAQFQLLGLILEFLNINDENNYSELSTDEIILKIENFMEPVFADLKDKTILSREKEYKGIYGAGAPKEYLFRMVKLIKQKETSFTPLGYENWENEQSEENIKKANEQVYKLNLDIQNYIFNKLKNKYGNEEVQYWEKGITNNEIKMQAYKKQLEDNKNDKHMPKEHYLDFIQYKKIIEQKETWTEFRNVFSIKMKSEDNGKHKYLSWMDKLNEIRKIYAHPTKERTYKTEHYHFLDWICMELDQRIDDYNE